MINVCFTFQKHILYMLSIISAHILTTFTLYNIIVTSVRQCFTLGLYTYKEKEDQAGIRVSQQWYNKLYCSVVNNMAHTLGKREFYDYVSFTRKTHNHIQVSRP